MGGTELREALRAAKHPIKALRERPAWNILRAWNEDCLLPWQGSGKELVKAGVSFGYEKRNIGEWQTARAAVP
jgi:hypothetical protein